MSSQSVVLGVVAGLVVEDSTGDWRAVALAGGTAWAPASGDIAGGREIGFPIINILVGEPP